MTNPSRYWAELASKNADSQELCDGIVNILVRYCFAEDAVSVPCLRLAVPIMYNKLTISNPDTRSSAIALDAARSTGLFDISKSKKDAEDRLVFEAAIVMLLYLRRDIVNYNYPYKSIAEFLNEYQDFQNESEEEIVKLFNFANCMKVAIQLIKPKLHKQQLLLLCTRLTEGKGVKYVTGSGQKAETKRRVQIYEHEGGVRAEPRPWRVSWSLITQLLTDEKDNVAEVDISQKLITSIQDQPDMKTVEMNQETVRFRHPTMPNVHVEATEMKSASGQTLMRATSLSHVKEDDQGNVVEATELHREFSITGEVISPEDLAWLNEADEALREVETLGEGDFTVSRQCVRTDGQLVKAITVSRQFPEAIETAISESGLSPDEGLGDFSDMLGSTLTRQFSGGAFGLLRSLSNGSPRNPINSLVGGLNSSPRADMVSNSGIVTGLSRMNSSNSVFPTSTGTSFGGLIRSFSGGSSVNGADVGSAPILSFPGLFSNGSLLASSPNATATLSATPTLLENPAGKTRPAPTAELPDHQAKKIKVEGVVFPSSLPNAADSSGPSPEQWGELYRNMAN